MNCINAKMQCEKKNYAYIPINIEILEFSAAPETYYSCCWYLRIATLQISLYFCNSTCKLHFCISTLIPTLPSAVIILLVDGVRTD